MPTRKFLSILSAGVVATALAVSLAACTTSTSAAGCTATAAGSNSAKVTVTGKFGASPKVTFTKGLTTKATERTVVTAGKGTAATDGSTVNLNYSVYNATSGKLIDTTGFGSSKAIPFTVDKTSVITGLYKAIKCSTAGTRVVAVIPPADAFGTSGQSSLGIGAKDSIVFVLDVDSVKLPTKTKVLDKPDASFPKVTFDSKGVPTVAKPTATAPTTLKVAYLKKGTGATVKSGDSVEVNYVGLVYSTGTVFDSSWASGTPATFTTSQVVTGFGKALVGQKVGSTVIAIIPPDEGYGSTGNSSIGVSGTEDMVFVISIIKTTAG